MTGLDLPLLLSGITASRKQHSDTQLTDPGDSPWTKIRPRANGPDLAQSRKNQVSPKRPFRQFRLHTNRSGFPGNSDRDVPCCFKTCETVFPPDSAQDVDRPSTSLRAGGDLHTYCKSGDEPRGSVRLCRSCRLNH